MRSDNVLRADGRNTDLGKIRVYLEMIKFQHSIFALPFAYLGAFLAEMKVPTFRALLWITLAMAGARSFAMSMNRLIDAELDRRNPRTADRALPKGLLSVSHVLIFSVISFGIFLVAVYNLAPICRYLWPAVIIPFVLYPYTKRFTWFSHVVLGFCLGLAPVGAWIAVTNSVSPEIFLIGGAVLFWVAGFDIFYAIQDIDFDRKHGLYSFPARFGIQPSLFITKVMHITAILLLSWAGLGLGLGFFYFSGVVVAAVLLAYENSIVKTHDLTRLNVAFFTMNGVISIILFCFVAIEVIFRRGTLV